MIQFIEHNVMSYPARTRANVENTDITIAFAIDFRSKGEILTKTLTENLGKLYIPWQINENHIFDIRDLDAVVRKIRARFMFDIPFDINIAGNSIHTLHKYGYTQKELDFGMSIFMKSLKESIKIGSITSGGQTGADEAGAKEANKLEIPTIVRAPKGWMFRNEQGIDIKNEKLFKERFN